MKKTDIDETKIPPVMEMIEKAAELMEEKDCEGNVDAKNNLTELQRKLREVTGNKKLQSLMAMRGKELWEGRHRIILRTI